MPIKELAKQFGKDLLVSKISGGKRDKHGRHHDQNHHGQRHHFGHPHSHGKATVGQALHEALKLSKHKGMYIKKSIRDTANVLVTCSILNSLAPTGALGSQITLRVACLKLYFFISLDPWSIQELARTIQGMATKA